MRVSLMFDTWRLLYVTNAVEVVVAEDGSA